MMRRFLVLTTAALLGAMACAGQVTTPPPTVFSQLPQIQNPTQQAPDQGTQIDALATSAAQRQLMRAQANALRRGAAGAATLASTTPPVPANYLTDGMRNGRAWMGMDVSMQLGYVAGYAEGLNVGAFTVASDRPDWLGAWWPTSATFGEVREWLGSFYAAPENRPIPVPIAIQIFQAKTTGTAQAKIDQQIEGSRQVYAAAEARDRAKAQQ